MSGVKDIAGRFSLPMSGKTVFHLALIVMAGLAAYSNTFDVPFHFDDHAQIADNPIVKDLGNFTSSSRGYLYNPRRYVGYFTLALNYRFGGLDVTGYHVVNLAIHILNSMLVYFLVILTFRTPYFSSQLSAISEQLSVHDPSAMTSDPPVAGDSRLIALFSALFFVSHPVQTQAVTYIVQRFTSLATLFYLLSVVMYVKGRLRKAEVKAEAEVKDKVEVKAEVKAEAEVEAEVKDEAEVKVKKYSASALAYFFLSFLSAVLAMKTKEISFTLPIMILLYEFTFFRSSLKEKLLFLIPVLLALAVIPASMMHTDKPLGEILSDLSEKTRLQTEISRGDYLMTEMRVIVTYIRLLLLPIHQNLDYDYPTYHSFFTPPVFISFLFLSAILGTAGYLLFKTKSAGGWRQEGGGTDHPISPLTSNLFPDAYYRLIAFGVLWFFIGLSVESSVIPIVDLIFEHRLYLPSVGAFVAFTAALIAVSGKTGNIVPQAKKAAIPLVLILVTTLSGVTYARNNVWRNSLDLWEDVVRKAPANARAQNNLGYVYITRGMADKAMEHLLTAVRLRPGYPDARINLGIVYNAKGMTDEAIEQFTIALRMDPDDADAHNNLGIAYVSKGMTDEAIRHYQTALRVNPDYPEAYNNMGVAYGTKGMFDQAISYFRYAILLKPDYFEAHYNLARAFLEKNDTRSAEEEYQYLVRTDPEAAKRLSAMLRDNAR